MPNGHYTDEDIRNDARKPLLTKIETLHETIDFLRSAILVIPEWMIYGNWDTPRCLWCGGFQYGDPVYNKPEGHDKACLRLRVQNMTETTGE